MNQSFVDQIVREIRDVPLARLPEVMAAIRGASGGSTTNAAHAAAINGRRMTADELAAKVLEVLELPGKNKLMEIQNVVVLHALTVCAGNVSAAARLLGVERRALERRVAKARRGR